MTKLEFQQRIIGFLNEEFAKIKQWQQTNQKVKVKAVEKKAKKLLNDIELMLRINAGDNEVNLKITKIKKEIKNYFSYLKLQYSRNFRLSLISCYNYKTYYIFY